jgi:hypothetical protein
MRTPNCAGDKLNRLHSKAFFGGLRFLPHASVRVSTDPVQPRPVGFAMCFNQAEPDCPEGGVEECHPVSNGNERTVGLRLYSIGSREIAAAALGCF